MFFFFFFFLFLMEPVSLYILEVSMKIYQILQFKLDSRQGGGRNDESEGIIASQRGTVTALYLKNQTLLHSGN